MSSSRRALDALEEECATIRRDADARSAQMKISQVEHQEAIAALNKELEAARADLTSMEKRRIAQDEGNSSHAEEIATLEAELLSTQSSVEERRKDIERLSQRLKESQELLADKDRLLTEAAKSVERLSSEEQRLKQEAMNADESFRVRASGYEKQLESLIHLYEAASEKLKIIEDRFANSERTNEVTSISLNSTKKTLQN